MKDLLQSNSIHGASGLRLYRAQDSVAEPVFALWPSPFYKCVDVATCKAGFEIPLSLFPFSRVYLRPYHLGSQLNHLINSPWELRSGTEVHLEGA
jgi:hypothetical protein